LQEYGVQFEIVGAILDAETIATGNGIRELARLREMYGDGRWRKRKGVASVQLRGGVIVPAELHWYEANGLGRGNLRSNAFSNDEQ
jgi:hypothetical protein